MSDCRIANLKFKGYSDVEFCVEHTRHRAECLKAEVAEWKSNWEEEHRLRTEDQERWRKAEAELDGMKQVNLDLLDDVAELTKKIGELREAAKKVLESPSSIDDLHLELKDEYKDLEKALSEGGGDDE